MEPDIMIFFLWMLSFKPTFSLSSFSFIKRLFNSLFSDIRVVSSAYLRLLIFLLSILIPPCASSSPEFLMMYSAYKWNKQGDNIQPGHTPFLIWNQSAVPCPTLTVPSWPAYRFLKRQVMWSGFPIFRIIVQSLLWYTQLKALAQAFSIAQLVKNLLAILETWVWFLGRENSLEKELANHSSILA